LKNKSLRGTVRAAMQPDMKKWSTLRAQNPAYGHYEEPIYRCIDSY